MPYFRAGAQRDAKVHLALALPAAVSPVSWTWVTRSEGSSSRTLASAEDSLTSSFRSVEASDAEHRLGGASATVARGAVLPVAASCRSEPSSLPSPTVSPGLRGVTLRRLLPMRRQHTGNAARPAHPARRVRRRRQSCAMTRATDSLPPWVVWSVFSTWTIASLAFTPSRARRVGDPGRLRGG